MRLLTEAGIVLHLFAAIALVGSGGGMMLGAIPLWLVGQRRINKAERRTTSDRDQATQPTVAIGPGGAALRWSF